MFDHDATEDNFEGPLDCIHQVALEEFCQACEDRGKHIVQDEMLRAFAAARRERNLQSAMSYREAD